MTDIFDQGHVLSEASSESEKKDNIIFSPRSASQDDAVKDNEVAPGYVATKDFEGHYNDVPLGEGIVPEEDDVLIDPRLKDYPIPLVAKTVDLRNDPT
jgi:hypothetical protein